MGLDSGMGVLLGLMVGIGLSAACGFRVFVPMLMASIASHAGYLSLGNGFEWLGSDVALVAFGVATIVEILAYYVPYIDHFLDGLGAPCAVVAGTLLTAAMVTDISPWLQWSLGIIAGGGSAAVVHAGTSALRSISSATTAGVGNCLVSSGEAVAAAGVSLLAMAAPFFGVILVTAALVVLFILWNKWKRKRFLSKNALAN